MARAFVNFYGGMDYGGYGRGAEAFQGRASQPHQTDAADVGANVTAPTKTDLTNGSVYAEIKPTTGNVFACILPSTATQAELTAARIRIDQGERLTLSAGSVTNPALFIWAA